MKPLLAPKPCSVKMRPLNQVLRALEAKRLKQGLTPEEEANLSLIYTEVERAYLSETEVDQLAEERGEARLHPTHVNFHE